MKYVSYVSMGIFILVMVNGCGSNKKPTLGDAMLQEGASAEQLGNQWNEGSALVIKGEKMKKKGQEKIDEAYEEIDEGKALISKGDRLINQGEKMIRDSESAYKLKFPNKTLSAE